MLAARMLQAAAGSGTPGAFVLDTLSLAPSAAYGLRRLSSAYTGAIVQARRASDGAVQDIGFAGSGDLDTAALAAFVGASSASAATWYDQSGNGYDLTAPSQTQEPLIATGGINGIPALQYGHNSQTQLVNASYTPITASPMMAVMALTATGLIASAWPVLVGNGTGQFSGAAAFGIMGSAGANPGAFEIFQHYVADSQLGCGFTPWGTPSVTSAVSQSGLVNGTFAASGYQNGALSGSASVSGYPTQPTGLSVGGLPQLAPAADFDGLEGYLGEVVLFDGYDMTARHAMERSQGAHFGISVA